LEKRRNNEMRRATAAITAPITIKAMRMLIVFTLLATAAAASATQQTVCEASTCGQAINQQQAATTSSSSSSTCRKLFVTGALKYVSPNHNSEKFPAFNEYFDFTTTSSAAAFCNVEVKQEQQQQTSTSPPGGSLTFELTVSASVSGVEAYLRSYFASADVIKQLFGATSSSSSPTFDSITIDIDECKSSLSNCAANFVCINKPQGFACIDSMCKMSEAPRTPYGGKQVVTRGDGEVWDSPDEVVEHGTEIDYSCEEYYDVVIKGTDKAAAPSICGRGGYDDTPWSGADVECVISMGFRIALIASVISGAIIVLISSLLIASWCSKVAPEVKERNDYDEELNLVYRTWEESQGRQV